MARNAEPKRAGAHLTPGDESRDSQHAASWRRVVALVGSVLAAVVLFGTAVTNWHVIRDELWPPSEASGSHSAPRTPVTVPPRLLDRDGNARYGLWFSYPVTWLRQGDPSNSDGNEFVSPDNSRVRLRFFGTQRLTDVRSGDSTDLPVNEYEKKALETTGATFLEESPQGLWWQNASDTDREHVDGWRFVYTYKKQGQHGTQTMIEIVADVDGRYAYAQCEAPSRIASQYQSLCNELVSSLVLTEGLDVRPHEPCGTFDCEATEPTRTQAEAKGRASARV